MEDVFAIFSSSADAQLFLNLLNNQHHNLRFAFEEASGPSLPLFVIEVAICDEEFDISVNCKLTFNCVPLHFNSIAPLP